MPKTFIVAIIIVILISLASIFGLIFPILKLTGNPVYHLGNYVFLQMKYIPAGTFLMGSPLNESCRVPNETQHEVTITRPFYMGIYEITQKEYNQVIGNNPAIAQNPQCPVEAISWLDSIAFCNTLSKQQGLKECYSFTKVLGYSDKVNCDWSANGFRLPTEAEWEYACRANTTTAYYWGTTMNDSYCWWGKNSRDGTGHPIQPVGTRLPNNWGLYDMSGNLWEMCWDGYGNYPNSSCTDPTGAENSMERVRRGGNFFCDEQYCRSAIRGRVSPGSAHQAGFRVVLPVK